MGSFPLVTQELVRRIAYDYGDDRLRVFQEIAGNPSGIEFHTFGRVQATTSSDDRYNFVVGLEDDADEALIDEIVTLYQARNRPPCFVIPSAFLSNRIARYLAKRGLYADGGCPIRYGVPRLPDRHPGIDQAAHNMTVNEVRDEEEMASFLSVLRDGSPMPAEFPEILHGMRWLGRPGWYPHLARVDGEPAGVGMLYVRNGTAYLTLAATLPAFRRRGCQSALLRHRIAAAERMGCDLVISSATFGSASQHNLERAGLQIAYTQTVWQPLTG